MTCTRARIVVQIRTTRRFSAYVYKSNISIVFFFFLSLCRSFFTCRERVVRLPWNNDPDRDFDPLEMVCVQFDGPRAHNVTDNRSNKKPWGTHVSDTMLRVRHLFVRPREIDSVFLDSINDLKTKNKKQNVFPPAKTLRAAVPSRFQDRLSGRNFNVEQCDFRRFEEMVT